MEKCLGNDVTVVVKQCVLNALMFYKKVCSKF